MDAFRRLGVEAIESFPNEPLRGAENEMMLIHLTAKVQMNGRLKSEGGAREDESRCMEGVAKQNGVEKKKEGRQKQG